MSLFALSTAQLRRVALPSRTLSGIGPLQGNTLPGSLRWKTTTTTTKAEKKSSDVTRAQLANSVASTHKLPKSESQRILKTVFDSIVEALGEGKTVKISSFGTFQKYLSKARTFKNIQTKEPIEVPEKNRIRFKAYKSMKEIVETSKPASPKARTTP